MHYIKVGLMVIKKFNVMNNTMICDHQGLFIYIDTSYLGSHHDVNIL